LKGCALIRELHVYGVLVAARTQVDEAAIAKVHCPDRPQHGGIGRTLMATAERLAASRDWDKIAVIAGVGVRNYYRRLGYELKGDGQYLIKPLPMCDPIEVSELEAPFLEATERLRKLDWPAWRRALDTRGGAAVAATVALAAVGMTALALTRRWRSSTS